MVLKSSFRYRTILLLLSPWLVLFVLWQAWRVRNIRFAKQRLGFSYPQKGSPLWIHCASVGEVTAALPLIRSLSAEASAGVVVSTVTATGAETLLRENLPNVAHAYLPLDLKCSVNKALNAITPRALVLLETELWPNLINAAIDRDVPVTVVNGRLSAKTLDAPQWIKPIYAQVLSRVHSVYAKSEQDAAGFVSLGTSADKVYVLGNLKYASVNHQQVKITCDITRPFWLAASTHDDEEAQLCAELNKFKSCSEHLLVIAPRHPDRSEKIQAALSALGVKMAVRSLGQSVTADTQIYLADRLGEMKMWMANAKVVFMGGSLVPVGGHNLLEPASVSRSIVTGPHLENVLAESELLADAGALYKANSAQDVLQRVEKLLGDSVLRQQSGKAGLDTVLDKASVLDRYVAALQPLINRQH